MASGNTLFTLFPEDASFPSSNPGGPSTRNGTPIIAFNQTTAEGIFFVFIMPRHYAGGGITCTIYCASASATSGNI